MRGGKTSASCAFINDHRRVNARVYCAPRPIALLLVGMRERHLNRKVQLEILARNLLTPLRSVEAGLYQMDIDFRMKN